MATITEVWKQELELRDIELDPSLEKDVLHWLEWWWDDNWDAHSDAIYAAIEECKRERSNAKCSTNT